MKNKKVQIKFWKRIGLIGAAAAVLLIATLWVTVTKRLPSRAQERFIQVLKERYQSDIEVKNFGISFFPQIRVTCQGLVFRHKGRTDVPPLISIETLSVEARLSVLAGAPKRAQRVRLEGLQISIPPRHDQGEPEKSYAARRRRLPFLIEEIIADGTRLTIFPKDADKEPLVFDISRLTLHSVGADRPLSFRATLTNPKPPGQIESTGEFGPWDEEEPSSTPVSGGYTFQNADLSVFRGVAGILSSEGEYKGVLGRIEVAGKTDTPNFSVRTSGKPVHLKTQFNAIVDGTKGDTYLQPVEAQFLRSSLLCRGGVIGTHQGKGKTVALDVTLLTGRIEDLLRLAIKSNKPPMVGTANFRTKFELPPGEEDVIDKLHLDGVFGLAAAQFTSPEVREKLGSLSRRAQGKPRDEPSEDVLSNLRGRFVLNKGVIDFTNLSFDVPGASLRLNGDYNLTSEKLDFRGVLRLQARLSQTTTGVKSFFLKAVDPFFRQKGVGTVLPIRITGTQERPSFGLDLRHRKSEKNASK